MFFALRDLPPEHRQHVVNLFTWLPAGGLQVEIGFLADPLSITFILFVTGVATLIHIYSIGYMHGRPAVLALLRLHEPVRGRRCWSWSSAAASW